jgi:hypothetical protein
MTPTTEQWTMRSDATQARGSHVLVPGIRQGFHLPPSFTPITLGAVAIAGTIVGWAIFAAVPVSNEASYAPAAGVPASSIRSVAYSVAVDGQDDLYVRNVDGEGAAELVGEFPFAFNFHAKGRADPTGTRIAVLYTGAGTGATARLSLLTPASGGRQDVEGEFDYLSPIAWTSDGVLLAVVRTETDGARRTSNVIEIEARSLSAALAATFEGAFEVAPVGYSLDGSRLYVVVVDQSGSSLQAVRAGRVQKVADLSPGRTRDWSLSPDGSRLAFVEVLGAAERSYAGRTLVVATGVVTKTGSLGNEIGSVWQPGVEVPVFGGPGGQVALSEPPAQGAYVVPVQYSPDGNTLVATVVSAAPDRASAPVQSVELVTPRQRIPLAPGVVATFFGWVQNH